VDYIVVSLRDMEEYKHLVCSHWNAMLRCVLHGDDHHRNSTSNSSSGSQTNNRLSIATQRVMIRMLVTAVQLEVVICGGGSVEESTTSSHMYEDMDFVLARRAAFDGSFQLSGTNLPTKKSMSSNNMKSQEELTLSLLKELPRLLSSFKSETTIQQSLTLLPQYFRKLVLIVQNLLNGVVLL
jgi:hypothetical protein